VVLLTFGTGIGSALLLDGKLVPNTELGHLELEGKDAEKRASSAAKDDEGLSFKQWAKRVHKYMGHVEKLFTPDLFVVGGGISKNAERWVPLLDLNTPVKPAQLLNNAGIVGAAMAAHEKFTE
jgi:polyphosphate glucokinase